MGHQEVVLDLVAAGADSDNKDSAGFTPLCEARAFGRREMEDFLLEKGADADVLENLKFESVEDDKGNKSMTIIIPRPDRFVVTHTHLYQF